MILGQKCRAPAQTASLLLPEFAVNYPHYNRGLQTNAFSTLNLKTENQVVRMSTGTSQRQQRNVQGKIVLFALAGLGILFIGAGIFWLVGSQGNVTTPSSLVGMPATRHITGQAALDDIARLHSAEIPMVDGAVTYYGDGQAVLWISSTWLPLLAGRQVEAMTARIAEGRSPFTPAGTRQVGGRTVYELTGMDQTHFYFQRDRLVVWLAVAPDLAEQSLEDLITKTNQ